MEKNYTLSYYELLEIPSNASAEEINQAYKKLAAKYHPDKNGDLEVANQHFKLLNEAREVLLDPTKREAHDYAIGIKKRPSPPPQIIEKEKRILVKDNSRTAAIAALSAIAGIFIGFWIVNRNKK